MEQLEALNTKNWPKVQGDPAIWEDSGTKPWEWETWGGRVCPAFLLAR